MASKHEQLQTITAQLESCASTTPNTTALAKLQERVRVLEQERDDLKKVCQPQTHNTGTHCYKCLQKGTGMRFCMHSLFSLVCFLVLHRISSYLLRLEGAVNRKL